MLPLAHLLRKVFYCCTPYGVFRLRLPKKAKTQPPNIQAFYRLQVNLDATKHNLEIADIPLRKITGRFHKDYEPSKTPQIAGDLPGLDVSFLISPTLLQIYFPPGPNDDLLQNLHKALDLLISKRLIVSEPDLPYGFYRFRWSQEHLRKQNLLLRSLLVAEDAEKGTAEIWGTPLSPMYVKNLRDQLFMMAELESEWKLFYGHKPGL